MVDDSTPTRRRFVAATAATGSALALAGCLGGGSGTATDTPTGDAMDDGMDETPTDTGEEMMSTTWEVTVENVSTGDTLQTMDGSVAVPLSPGAYAVHTGMSHLFTPGEGASDGLESLAEDGKPGGLASMAGDMDGILDSGAFTTPDGADGPAPLKPGDTYTFEVSASADSGAKLSLATMFVQSNDLFYAPAPSGISLFDGGEPVSGDVTDQLSLWDAGTEVNQPPGEGADQAPRQSSTDTGEDENGTVRKVDDEYEYPATGDVIEVTLSTM